MWSAWPERRTLLRTLMPVRVAVMGCIVNGLGEAADADGRAAKGKGFLTAGVNVSPLCRKEICRTLYSRKFITSGAQPIG